MNSREDQDLGWGLRLGWGVGSLGASTLVNGVTFLALYYFTRVLGLDPVMAGALLFMARLFDIVTDPILGVVSDRVRSPGRRRRPFMLAGALLSGLAFLLLFNAPAWRGSALAAWCGGALLLYATGFTLFVVPYLAMPAEMTTSYHERSRLMSVRVVFASLGILAGGALAPALVAEQGGGRNGFAGMSVALALLIAASMFACWAATRGAAFTTPVPTTLGVTAQLRSALGNRPFAWLLASKLAHMSGVAVTNTSLLFLVTGVLGRPEGAAGIFGLTAVAGAILSMPAWLAASRRYGKRNTYVAAAVLYVPLLLTWLLATPGEPGWGLIARGLGIGLVTGGLTLTAQAMLPDAIEHDAQRSGLRREASFAAVYSAVEKTAAAIGPLLVGFAVARAGDGDEAGAVRYTAALLPAGASALSAVLLAGYNLDRRRQPTPGENRE